jgi:hypothetical protein
VDESTGAIDNLNSGDSSNAVADGFERLVDSTTGLLGGISGETPDTYIVELE